MAHQLLLCTDLDRTLIPNGQQPESPRARPLFSSLAAHPQVTLAYVSGRDRELVLNAIQDYQLPRPDWIIGDVGSTIYRLNGAGLVHWTEWDEAIADDWNGNTGFELRGLFRDLASLKLQEDSKQNTHKLSYYLPLEISFKSLEPELRHRLGVADLQSSLIYSVDEEAQVGLLDILPSSANKLNAIRFLMQSEDFTDENTVFAGDSGNDLSVLCSEVPSVLVANARADVVKEAVTQASENNTSSSLYLAQGGFMDLNGHYSAGILEGVCHFHPEMASWLA